MSREVQNFTATFLSVASHMQEPAPSSFIDALVDMANSNPSHYVVIAPNGQLAVVHGTEVDDATGDTVWLPFEKVCEGLGVPAGHFDWLMGETGIREDIWPQPMHRRMLEAYKAYSLFGIGDEYDRGV